MKYEIVLFDLDGTLTDSGPGVMNSVRYMLEKYGITDPDPADLRACVGPPLTDSFEQFWGFDHEKALAAVEVYRERYKPIGIFENSVYDGIPEALEALVRGGCRLYVATSKPTAMATQVLNHFGLARFFSEVAGATEDEKLCRKDDIIEDLLRRLDLSPEDKARACMVGDRKFDVNGGKKFGLATIGVTWGYQPDGELAAAGADFLVDTPAEMAEVILG